MAIPLTADEHLRILVENLRKLRWTQHETTKTLAYELDRNAVAVTSDTLRQLLEIVEIIVMMRLS